MGHNGTQRDTTGHNRTQRNTNGDNRKQRDTRGHSETHPDTRNVCIFFPVHFGIHVFPKHVVHMPRESALFVTFVYHFLHNSTNVSLIIELLDCGLFCYSNLLLTIVIEETDTCFVVSCYVTHTNTDVLKVYTAINFICV